MQLQVRPSNERGHADHGWLDSHHTFSFADYYDPSHMGFRALRVINEDRVAPGGGFPTHGHADMEILTYVLDGKLSHEDSLGNGSTIQPGDVQRMSAGTGVRHSEMNASRTEPVHFLQIWILPDRKGHAPGYEQKAFTREERTNRLRVVASPDGRDGSITVHQDAVLASALLDPGQRVTHPLADHRYAWVQVAQGAIEVNGHKLVAGDGVAAKGGGELTLVGLEAAEVLVFDLA